MPDAVENRGLTYLQRLEISRIERSAGVVPASVRFSAEGESECVSFLIRTETTAEPSTVDVRDVEEVNFIYNRNRRFGETAPTNVVIGRVDFPKDVGHVCSAGDEGFAVPCLAIGGIRPLYERAGIEAVMVRLRDFLRDAKTGGLMSDGWEPVPFAVDQALRPGEIKPRFFQELAHGSPTASAATGVAVYKEEANGRYVAVLSQAIPHEQMIAALGTKVEQVDLGRGDGITERKRRGVPWVFVWSDPASPTSVPIFGDWRTMAELRQGMERMGVLGAFTAQVGDLLTKGLNFEVYRPGTGGKSLAVVLGIWRPSPISAEYFGYSDDPAARKLELRAFLVTQRLTGKIVDDDAEVETLIGVHPPTPDLLRWVAGVDVLPPIAFVGMGALGSAIFSNLLRSGLDDVAVLDDDILQSHNLARHTGGTRDLFKPKIDHTERLAADVVRDGVTVTPVREDVTQMAIDALQTLVEGRLLIDATADERVRLRLDELPTRAEIGLVRAEIFHEGRLGVTFVSSPGGPTLAELMLSLITSATVEPAVASWLEYEEANPFGPVPLLYGFGCTSQTVHLPNHVVAQHASVATATIIDGRSEAGIAINPLDDKFRPLGWRWFPIEPFVTLIPATEPDWQIRLSDAAARGLSDERTKGLPMETGGYLYGGWDPVRKTITITSVTPLPAGSVCSPTELTLRPAGDSDQERRLLRKTRGRIHLCGTWHSHVSTSAQMSSRDYITITAHRERDVLDLKPTLMIIVAEGAMAAHLMVP